MLTKAAGAWYDEFSNLADDVPVHALGDSSLQLPPDAAGTRWVDGLTVTDATVLAGYEHPHFGRWPAVTTRAHGHGRITYVGTLPNRALARALFAWLAPTPVHGWQALPDSVTVTTGRAPGGGRVHVVHNWSWDEVSATPPGALSDVLAGRAPVTGALTLGPWDVRVLVK